MELDIDIIFAHQYDNDKNNKIINVHYNYSYSNYGITNQNP